MPIKSLFSTVPFIAVLLVAIPAHAQVYHWIDANGLTHYSDKAPKTQSSRQLNVGKVMTVPAFVKPKVEPNRTKKRVKKSTPVRTPKKLVARTRQVLRNSPEQASTVEPEVHTLKEIHDVKRMLCMDSRKLLAALKETGFNSYYGEDGEYRLSWGLDNLYEGHREYLTDKQVAQKTRQVQSEIRQYCYNPYDKKIQATARANWIRSEYCAATTLFLNYLENPMVRESPYRVDQQREKVKRFCSKLEAGKHRNDERYYPKFLHKRTSVEQQWHTPF